MHDARIALRSLIIYVVCISLALFLGYVIANPLDLATYGMVVAMVFVISSPILLRFHYSIMLLSWNAGAIAFLIPGRPNLWMATIFLSYLVSFTHRILDKRVRFISVPPLTWPLLVLGVVVLVTAQMRGGIGLEAFGGELAGGRKYLMILLPILGFFALTTRVIPRERALLYVGLFFVPGACSVVSNLFNVISPVFNFLFLIFPPVTMGLEATGFGAVRLGGVSLACLAVISYLLARHGLRNMLAPGEKYRFALLCLLCGLMMLGGFRSFLILLVLILGFQFWLEGLHQSRWMGIFALSFLFAAAVALPFAQKLPYTIQRSLAFLPLNWDPMVKYDTDSSNEWRLEIWRAALPEVPGYLLLGKGCSITREEFNLLANAKAAGSSSFIGDRAAFVAGDYHNGPLSVLLTFGIWGAGAFIWFVVASLLVLRDNLRYGAPELTSVNVLLLSAFAARILLFIFVVGSLPQDMLMFAGLVGFSVALNGGVAQRVAMAPAVIKFRPGQPEPAGGADSQPPGRK